MIKNGEKKLWKTEGRDMEIALLSLETNPLVPHDSYESTCLTVHHHETKDATMLQTLPFFTLEQLSASPERPIMWVLITHYVKFT